MKRYLLDTSILIDFINRRFGVEKRAEEVRQAGSVIGTSLPVVGECFFGIEGSDDPAYYRKLFQRGLYRVTRWPFTMEAAEVYGKIANELKKSGRVIQQIDMQTAAIALTLGNCTIVTTDSDFTRISGLSIENWRTP